MKKVTIDMVSDIVCPWCIVGYKRLQQAAALLDDIDITVNFHPFELNPSMPEDGQNLREHVMEKYGISEAQSKQARAQLIQAGEEVGFSFNYADDTRMVNTFKAHQLLHYARTEGKEEQLKLRLFSAFFSESKNINAIDILIEEADAVGLDIEKAKNALESGQYADVVRAEENRWMQMGIQSVPTFVIGDQGIAGAQPPETLANFIRESVQSLNTAAEN
ncbi:DsbA family oxidoreductase [Alteromonas sp. A079]|uniref:DsbA family oxidoreductase n=1 Tax=Alteromonas sp. A079 TaxID=3410268 RepID=UPI003BA2D1A5